MKDLKELFTSPEESMAKKKKKKVKTKKKHKKETYLINETEVVRKKKIKIRLADPNDPNSYICEIYDTSFENDDVKTPKKLTPARNTIRSSRKKLFDVKQTPNEMKTTSCESEKTSNVEPPGKTFFDVLMSKESRQSFNLMTGRDNEVLGDERRVEEEAAGVVEGRMKRKAVLGRRLGVLARRRAGKGEESSDDENLFQVQSRLKNSTKILKGRNSNRSEKQPGGTTANSEKNEECKENGQKHSESVIVVRPEVKNKPNIMNYFTKVEIPQKAQMKRKMKKGKSEQVVKKLKEIDIFEGKNVKLAPMFHKKVKIDPKVKKAREEFLKSGLPKSVRKCLEESQKVEVSGFERVVHVRQDEERVDWGNEGVQLELRDVESFVWDGGKRFRWGVEEEKRCKSDKGMKEGVRGWEGMEAVFEEMKRKKEEFEKKELEMLEFDKSQMEIKGKDNSLEILEENNEGPNPLWLEKYKLGSSHFFGNDRAVGKVRRWLETWKRHEAELKNSSKEPKRPRVESSDESDAFVDSDEGSERSRAPINACFLRGPCASGKTALVYALAAELGFGVLEMNVSSKRTGKIVLQELQEATQSHKVLSTTSLILVDDGDLVFEQDEGFTAALSSLLQAAKRPVVVTSTTTCAHLERLRAVNGGLCVHLGRVGAMFGCRLLNIISHLEHEPTNLNTSRLFEASNRDLRRSLLELQFWGGVSHLPAPSRPSHTRLWHALTPLLPQPRTKSLPTLRHFFESLSAVDVLQDWSSQTDVTVLKDGLCIAEGLEGSVAAEAQLSTDLSGFLVDSALRVSGLCVSWDCWDQPSRQQIRWEESRKACDKTLSTLAPPGLKKSSLCLDHLAALRTLCRAEKNRLTLNTKRRNRFCHYLKTLGAEVDENCFKTVEDVLKGS